jgi:hypothetical protein
MNFPMEIHGHGVLFELYSRMGNPLNVSYNLRIITRTISLWLFDLSFKANWKNIEERRCELKIQISAKMQSKSATHTGGVI